MALSRPAAAYFALVFGAGFVLGADLGVGVLLRGMTLSEALLNRDPVSGTAYYAMRVLFALMPFLIVRRGRAGDGPKA